VDVKRREIKKRGSSNGSAVPVFSGDKDHGKSKGKRRVRSRGRTGKGTMLRRKGNPFSAFCFSERFILNPKLPSPRKASFGADPHIPPEPGGRFVSLIDRVQFFVQVDFINLSVFLHQKSVFVAANEQRPDNQTFHAFLFGHAQMPGQA
jgi:hypothetical protein